MIVFVGNGVANSLELRCAVLKARELAGGANSFRALFADPLLKLLFSAGNARTSFPVIYRNSSIKKMITLQDLTKGSPFTGCRKPYRKTKNIKESIFKVLIRLR